MKTNREMTERIIAALAGISPILVYSLPLSSELNRVHYDY